MIRHGSLFSGIGGFDLAAEWMGWENVFHCEWNEFGQKVLKHYWPKAISYHDITKTDFTIHRGDIDILTGGFPCQPYSLAGKRKGKEDERHLWPEMLRAIREIQPRWVVGENVFGLINWSGGLVFHEVQTDLEVEGYEVFPYVLPACAVNAPHRRDRVWFVAYRNDTGSAALRSRIDRNGKTQGSQREQPQFEFSRLRNEGNASDTSGSRLEANNTLRKPKGEVYTTWLVGENDAANANGIGQPGKEYRQAQSRQHSQISQINGWDNFPTQSPICSGDDGLPTELDGITFSKWRNESIKAYGNAVVPQVVYQIFKTIEAYEQM